MAGASRVVVVVDSTVSLPEAATAGLPIHVVPLEIVLDSVPYRDGVDITPDEFYRRLPRLTQVPKTSSPPPGSFAAAFQDVAASATDVLCITVSARLSATFDAARVAADSMRAALPSVRIEVMDSGTAGGGEGLVALAAARAARSGAALEEVARVARGVSERVHFLGVMDTLLYVWRGGRVPRIAHWTTTLLDIKPVLDLWRGEVRLIARPRTRRRAIERMLAVMGERVGQVPVRVVVMHADALGEAEALLEAVTRRFRCVETLVVPFTPVIGAHTGPGLLALAFHAV